MSEDPEHPSEDGPPASPEMSRALFNQWFGFVSARLDEREAMADAIHSRAGLECRTITTPLRVKAAYAFGFGEAALADDQPHRARTQLAWFRQAGQQWAGHPEHPDN
ncbi:hypothetical protein [Actinacidiphila sp. bgisy160]|uniref:hypothetical protein n=1 Tax=Actinacidiphila sp. bgisy160 TaxID=3413796 RepID=UPI003D72E9CE